jgi:hypothetical protein
MRVGTEIDDALESMHSQPFSGELYADGLLLEGSYWYRPQHLAMEIRDAPGELPPWIKLERINGHDRVMVGSGPDEIHMVAEEEAGELRLFRFYDPRVLLRAVVEPRRIGADRWEAGYSVHRLGIELSPAIEAWFKARNISGQRVEVVLQRWRERMVVREVIQDDFAPNGSRLRLRLRYR